jgi:hypothetical protein
MNISKIISQIPEEEKTPLVAELSEIILFQYDEIQRLKDEIARLKGEKGKPVIKPSKLEEQSKDKNRPENIDKKRPGSDKKKKKLKIDRDEVIKPKEIPEGSEFKGYQDYIVQDIIFKTYNIRYRLERWESPQGDYIIAKVPENVAGHFGNTLKTYILYQYYHCHVTQPLIKEQLWEVGIQISSGQINRILIEDKERFHKEKEDILKAGIEVSDYINADDTGARHKGKNGYCTHIGNDKFAYFESTESKSRINFLKVLRSTYEDYALNADAVEYMANQRLPQKELFKLSSLLASVFPNEQAWQNKLAELDISSPRNIQIATEGALLGSISEHGFNPELVIVSDDAGQFNIFIHALCWIHAERSINKLVGFNDEQKDALKDKQSQIWDFYAKLKDYKECPNEDDKSPLSVKFDEIFTEKTCFASLNKALERIHKNKRELLRVLERPEIPLHNNQSEQDIREYVKRRKVSGSTRSSPGRRCRDTFTSLKKTCRKLGISFWNYLKDRLNGEKYSILYLPDLIRTRAS